MRDYDTTVDDNFIPYLRKCATPLILFIFVFVFTGASIKGADQLSAEIGRKHLHLNFSSSTEEAKIMASEIQERLISLSKMFSYKLLIELLVLVIIWFQILLRKNFTTVIGIINLVCIPMVLSLLILTVIAPHEIPNESWDSLPMGNYFDAGICACLMDVIYIAFSLSYIKVN